ncbi:MAG: Rad52/Rad22 family DNA repair protein [Blastocatellia bacterium]
MSVAIEDSKLLINRAKTIAAMGMVERDYEGFNVVSPGINKETFRVWRDEEGRIRCSCAEFENRFEQEPRFRCEHIFAVKFHLEPPDEAAGERPVETGKQQIKAQEEPAPRHGDDDEGEVITLPFAETLKELSHAVSPELVKQRVGWRDRMGREHEVDYVEWHAVADLLDRICPDWSHQVHQIKQIGDFVAITASITIKGVTRQGVGTGSAYDEKGIKKAEHDALKRAAVKFGIARELYRKEEEASPQKNGRAAGGAQQQFPSDPIAKTMADLVTPKQLVAIRAIANAQGVNAEAECLEVLKCRPEELSRRAASAFIDHLKSKTADVEEVRHAG